jgi:outer membrane protein assembly factor BamB
MFYSIDAASGQANWKYATEGKILGSANTVPSQDGPPHILVGSYDFKLYCLDATNGKPIWTYETGNYINGSCAVAGGQIVFGGCDAMLHVLAATNGTKIKEIDTGAPIAASAALSGNWAYFGYYENEFLGVNISEGKVAWRYHHLWRRRPCRRIASFLEDLTRRCIASIPSRARAYGNFQRAEKLKVHRSWRTAKWSLVRTTGLSISCR